MARGALALLLCALALPTSGQDTQDPLRSVNLEKKRPLWSVDLKPFGFRTVRRGVVNDPGSFVSVAFASNTVAVTFDKILFLPRLERPYRPGVLGEEKAIRIITLAFAALDGKQQGSTWVDRWLFGFGLFAVAHNKFLLYLPETLGGKEFARLKLSLLSSDLRLLEELQLSAPGQAKREWWAVHVSPSGNSVLLTLTQDAMHKHSWLRAETLEWTAEWQDELSAYAISDNTLVTRSVDDAILIRRRDTRWGIVSILPGYPTLLTDELVLVTHLRSGTFEVLKTTGDPILSIELANAHREATVWPPPVVSATGTRFAAVVEFQPTSALERVFVPTQTVVLVWELSRPEPIFATQVKRAGLARPQIALSPDGALLAIVSDAKLQVFALPPPRSPSPPK